MNMTIAKMAVAFVLGFLVAVTLTNAMTIEDNGAYVPDRFGRAQCNVDLHYDIEQDRLIIAPSFFDLVAQAKGGE